MPISRRTLALAPLAAAAPLRAEEVEEPVVLPLAMTDPEEIFAALRDAVFTTALLPHGYGAQEAVDWDDREDSDLDGVIGALLVGPVGTAADAYIGAIIVHPDVDIAGEQVMTPEDGAGAERSQEFAIMGLQGRSIVDYNDTFGYATAAISIGPVVVSGVADVATYPDDYIVRAVTHLVAILDHIKRVTRIIA